MGMSALLTELDAQRGKCLLASFCRLSALAYIQLANDAKLRSGKTRKGKND